MCIHDIGIRQTYFKIKAQVTMRPFSIGLGHMDALGALKALWMDNSEQAKKTLAECHEE